MKPTRFLLAIMVLAVVAILTANAIGNHWWNHSIAKPFNIICNKAGEFGYVDVDGNQITWRQEMRTTKHDYGVTFYTIRANFTNRVQAVQAMEDYRATIEATQEYNIIHAFKVCP